MSQWRAHWNMIKEIHTKDKWKKDDAGMPDKMVDRIKQMRELTKAQFDIETKRSKPFPREIEYLRGKLEAFDQALKIIDKYKEEL